MTPNLNLSPVKLSPQHLDRKAIIYIRQSSPKQVRENIDSQLTQRALVERAQHLGWHPIGSRSSMVIWVSRQPVYKSAMTLKRWRPRSPWAMLASSLAGRCRD